jgi:hypothetical protein
MVRKKDDIDQDLEKDFDDIDDSVLKEAPPDMSKTTRRGRTSNTQPAQRKKTSRVSNPLSDNDKGSVGNMALRMAERPAILVLSAALFVTLVLYLVWDRLFASALLVGAAGMIVFFLYLFTGGISRVKLNGMVVYCYLFTATALIGSILPFFYFNAVILNEDNMLKTPLGIVRACVSVKADDTQRVPPEISCANKKAQWVINMGGTVKKKFLSKCQSLDYRCINEEKKKYPERWSDDNVQVSGGLVIPLYVMILAIIGAAVNMTRRVPEYQRQVYEYMKNDDEHHDEHDTMSPEDAREFMVFQLMQVVSAPIIAITAYYFLVPASYTTSVLLGFFSGFAAETILVAMRALADRLLPSVQSRSKMKAAKTK